MPYRSVVSLIGGGIGAYPSYRAPIFFRVVTTNRLADTICWAMLNLGTKSVVVRHIQGTVNFDGSPATSSGIVNVIRVRGTALSDTSATPVRDDSWEAATSVVCGQNQAGITITDGAYDNPLGTVGLNHALTGTLMAFNLILGDEDQFILHPGEGLAIRVASTLVVGWSMSGIVSWHEVP